MDNLHINFSYYEQWCIDTSSMLGFLKSQSANNFSLLVSKTDFSLLFSYGSCPRPRSRSKRSARTQIVCCWLLQITYMVEMKAGSTAPPVQLIPLSPTFLTRADHTSYLVKVKGDNIFKTYLDTREHCMAGCQLLVLGIAQLDMIWIWSLTRVHM